ncbi:hypothetical protein [Streptomyces jumonjinensis]|uniref:Uncharacterized protein n=1 Tax=Streptomyces jumonjinensis TaxID=1945 RepID=A0A646KKK7_STRJU|nr:hypothetical protein [Streptomyces jumonjinensis]MQT02763.1 hypothetical protein [Streptomyces jumonjinensis]
MSTGDARTLAESVLREEFRRRLVADPKEALAMVEELVLSLHVESLHATAPALGSGVTWREIGRALALVDDAGILLRQAAALLLGLPAADRAAEHEMVAQALAEHGEQEEGETGELLSKAKGQEPDVWAAAVDRFRRGVRGQVL